MDKFEAIRSVRERTQISMALCRQALEASGWDVEAAVRHIRDSGLGAPVRDGKKATEGRLGIYVHQGSSLAAMVEVATETDFAARSEIIGKLADFLAMQVAATDPTFVDVDSVPDHVRTHQLRVFHRQMREKMGIHGPDEDLEAAADGRIARAVHGKYDKWCAEACLMSQPKVDDPTMTVADHVRGVVAAVREKVEIRRFVRWRVGS